MVKSDSIVKLLPAGQVKIENYYREDIAMKIKRLSSVLIFLGLSVVAFGQKYIPEDDLYYQPKDKNPIVEKKKTGKIDFDLSTAGSDDNNDYYNSYDNYCSI